MSTILRTKNYDPSVIVLGTSTEKAISFYYPIGNDEFSKLRIQTPKLRIPFDPEDKKTKNNKLFVKNISLSTDEIGTSDNKQLINKFRTLMSETDEKLMGLLPESVRSKDFTPTLWQGKNIKYSPIMKISMNYKDEKCQTSVYDSKDAKISENDVIKGIVISAIIRLDGVWVSNNKTGVNWVAEQIKIYEKPEEQGTFKFRKIEDE